MRGVDRIEFWIFLAENGNPASWFRRLDAGNDLDQRRLAGPVFTDKAMHLADLQRQIDIAKRAHAAEALRYAGHLQESRQGFVLQWDRSIKQSPRRGPDFRPERLGMRLDKAAGLVCPRALRRSARRWFPC